ncbi:MAG: radical SAM protein [Pseudomonadota bacterium]
MADWEGVTGYSVPLTKEKEPTMYAEKPALHRRQRLHRAGELRTVSVDVTPQCNMSCNHCYAETFRRSTPVDMDVLVAALEEFHDLGVFHWVFQGGEPIVDLERLEAVLLACHPDESYITVVSNGWEMTRDRIHWLRQLKVDKIAFSMDSGIPHEHDAGRLPGSFARVCKAVDDVVAEGLLASVSITVTRTSLYSEGFRAALAFAQSRRIRVDIQIAEPVGRWEGRTDILIRPEDAAYLKKLQTELPVLPNGQWAAHRDIYSGKQDHCPAGTEFMAVSSSGHVLPCNFLQYHLGKIGKIPIEEMRNAIVSSPWFDGTQARCVLGEDQDFIGSFVLPYQDTPKPLDAYSVFGIRRPERRR